MDTIKPIISQKEYLKKYLSKEKGLKKKRKKQKICSSSHLKRSIIIDDDGEDDTGLKNVASIDDDEFNFEHLGDEAPQIVAVIDERISGLKPSETISLHTDKTSKSQHSDSDLSPERLTKKVNKEKSLESVQKSSFGKENVKSSEKQNSDSDLSPERSLSKASRDRRNKNHRNKTRKPSTSDSELSPDGLHFKKKAYSEKRDYGKNNTKYLKKHSSDSDLSPDRLERIKRKRKENKNFESQEREIKKRSSFKSSRRDSSDSDLSLDRLESKRGGNLRRHERGTDQKRKKSDHRSFRRYSSDSDFPSERSNKSKSYKQADHHLERRDSNSDKYRKQSYRYKDDYDKHAKSRLQSRSERKDKDYDSDMSPPRKTNRERRVEEKSKISGRKDSSTFNIKSTNKEERYHKSEKTLDGKRAGLQDAKNLKEELRLLKEKEDTMFRKMDKKLTGESASVIVRDRKTGKIRNLSEEKEVSIKESEKDKELKNKYAKWGRGLKQIEDAEEKLASALREMNKPLARYADDDDLDKMLRSREREGDPMLDYIRSKQDEAINVETEGRPKYRGHFMPNRFGIPPGHRWDGVDRSNGYEKEWFQKQNSRKAVVEEAYKWSTAEM